MPVQHDLKLKAGHCLGWLLFTSLVLAFLYRDSGIEGLKNVLLTARFWMFIVFYVALFYFNLFFLLPRFYYRNKAAAYSVISLVFLAAVYCVSPFENFVFQPTRHFRQPLSIQSRSSQNPPPPPRNRQPDQPQHSPGPPVDIISLMLWGLVWATGMFVAASDRWQKAQQTILHSKAEQARAELAFLKAQINPHFLFNTLSNLYTLAILKSDETASGILKLSDLMRYIVEDSSHELVSLTSEINFIRNYIALQQIRLSEFTAVKLSIGESPPGASIAPMILITFVENAFKYGVSTNRNVTIEIAMKWEGYRLRFFCYNQKAGQNALHQSTGVGIANTRARLAHLYPGRHELRISENQDVFEVALTIDLSPQHTPAS